MQDQDQETKIANKPIAYKENTVEDHAKELPDPLTYDIREGERILVYGWFRYPAYDFIFGVPAPDNPHYGQEVGFFQYRDTRTKEIRQGFYVDCQELLEMVEGFSKIFNISKATRPEMWRAQT